MCTDCPLARFIYAQCLSLDAISVGTSDWSAETRRGVIFRPLSKWLRQFVENVDRRYPDQRAITGQTALAVFDAIP
jgi:hypothetical protein